MLRKNLFTIPGTDSCWNREQCIGFLLHAVLLQKRKNRQQMQSVDPDDTSESCIFTGAAGTGKTSLLTACDVLTQFFSRTLA